MQLQRIYKLTQPELKQIVSLHQNSLKESVLNQFGDNFLNIVYQSIVADQDNFFLIIKDNEHIVGYLAATKNINIFYSNVIKKNLFYLVLEIIKYAFGKPRLLFQVIRWFVKPKNNDKPFAELQFIAIDQRFQGKGLGTSLIKELNKLYVQTGITRYKVSTWENNILSNNFYKKLGFKLMNQKKLLGVNFNYYISPK